MRLQPWTEAQLMSREEEFEELTAKAVQAAVRTLRRQLAAPLTAAVQLPGAPPETAPEVSFTSVQGAVMATWTTQVQEHLMPFLVDTFLMSAETVVDGVEAATGTAVEALTNIYAQDFLEYARNRMVGIGEELWVKIRSELSAGFAAGEGIKEIAARLQDVAELSLPRALTVARTEVISAANAGSYLQMIDAGFADNEVKKVWLATEDPRTRKSHRHADNQGVNLTGEFALDIYSGDVKTGEEFLEFPGDPSGTPGNTINCRCSLAFDFDEDAVLTADAFIEAQHPRDKDGKFKKKGAPDLYVKVPDKAPSASDPDNVKVAWIVQNKWGSMGAGQKAVLIKSITPATWKSLPPDLKEKVQNAPDTTSNPEAKIALQKALDEKSPSWEEGPLNVKQQIEKAVGEAVAAKKAAPAAAPSARPTGGTLQKTGKKLEPGKPVFLRVQLLYQTDFEDGAVMAVRKESDERIVFQGGKILRQKKGADGKFKTTQSFTKKQAYDAWKDEGGWTIPDAAEEETAAAAPSPAAGVPAAGAGVDIKVKLIYQTPFNDGDVVATNPGKGEYITWNAGKKRMVVHHADGSTTEYTRGALYKAYKDDTGWHKPASKGPFAAPAPAPAKKAAPPAKKAAPKAKKISAEDAPPPTFFPDPADANVPASDAPGQALKKFSPEEGGDFAAKVDNEDVEAGALLYEDANLTIHKANYADGGDLFVMNKQTGKTKVIKNKNVDAGYINEAVQETAKPDAPVSAQTVAPEPYKTVNQLSPENNSSMENAVNNPAVPVGTVLGDFSSSKITKTGDGQAELSYADILGSGSAPIQPGEWTTDKIIDKVLKIKKDVDEKAKAKVQYGTSANKVIMTGDSEVATDDVADMKELFDQPNTYINDKIFENPEIEIEKLTDDMVMVTHKGTGSFYSIEIDDLTADKLNDFIEDQKPTPPDDLDVSTPSVQAQQAYNVWIANEGKSAELFDDGEVQVYKASSGKVLIQSSPGVASLATGILAKENVTPANIDKAVKAVKAGHDFSAKDPIPEVGEAGNGAPGGSGGVSAGQDAVEISAALNNVAKEDITTGITNVWTDPNTGISAIKAENGSIGIVKSGNTGFASIEGYDDVTPEQIQKALDALDSGLYASGNPYKDVKGFLPSGPAQQKITASTPELIPDSSEGTFFSEGQSKLIEDALNSADVPAWHSFYKDEKIEIYKGSYNDLNIGENKIGGKNKQIKANDVTPEAIQEAFEDLGVFPVDSPAPSLATPAAVGTLAAKLPLGTIPDVANLKFTGQVLGTHHGKVYKDENGQQWLFKAAPASFKAAAQADLVTAKLHAQLGLSTPDTGIVELDGQTGSIQKLLPGNTPWNVNFNPANLSAADTIAIQKEHIFDWLVSNQDAHAMNLLKTPNGDIVGIDKGQAFKWMGQDKLEYNFKPNEHPQAANVLYKAFGNGSSNVTAYSPEHTPELANFMQKIKSIPDAQYKELLRPYAEQAAKDGKLAVQGPASLGLKSSPIPSNDVEAFLNLAVARKNNIDADIQGFYNKALADHNASLGISSPINPPSFAAPSQPVTSPLPGLTLLKQKPLKMTAALLTGPKSTQYKDGQVIAENPGENERIYWSAGAKKYVVQAQDVNGKWTTLYSYNKSAALKNLQGDAGWVTPSQPFIFDAGDTPGQAPKPSISTSAPVLPHQLAPKVSSSAPVSLFGSTPKFSVAELQAQADKRNGALLSTAQKNSLYNLFRTKGSGGVTTVRLNSDPKDQFEGLLEAYVAFNQANPGNKTSLLQILRAVDEVAAQKANVPNTSLFENKVVAWLGTSEGKNAVQNIASKVTLNQGSDKKVLEFNKTIQKFQTTAGNRANGSQGWKNTAAKAFQNQQFIKPHTAGQQYPFVNSTSAGSAIGSQMRMTYGAIPSNSKDAMQAYTGTSYTTMNDYLRSFGKDSIHQAGKVKLVEDGMKPIPQAITVHRNVGTVFDGSWQPSLDQLKQYVGTTFREDAFASTSIDGKPFNGQPYRFIIEVPEGTPLQWVQEFSQVKSENEFLLASGLHYEILEVLDPSEWTGPGATVAGKKAVVRMRIVPPPADTLAQIGVSA